MNIYSVYKDGAFLHQNQSLCFMLDYYKVYNKEKTIFSGVIHDNGEAEVTLSKGLGKYIDPYTKNQIIFDHGKLIIEICTTVMDRRSAEAQWFCCKVF